MTFPGHGLTLAMTVSLLVLPVILVFVLAWIAQKNFSHHKYLIFLLPQVLLLFAWGFQGLRLRSLQIATGLLYSFLIGLALFHFYADPVHFGRRTNWRDAAMYLKEHLDKEVSLVLFEDTSYNYLNYYSYGTRPFWIRVKVPTDSDRVTGYASYLRGKLAHTHVVYYLREDDKQNTLDPKDVIPKALRMISTDEQFIPYNRRLQLYKWNLAKDH